RAGQQLRDGRVVRGVGVEGRRQLDQVEDVVVRVAIVEHAGTAADGRPSVTGDVPRETDARGQLEGMLLLWRAFEDFHAVDEVSGVRHQPSDVDRRQGLAGDGIPREAGP